jgi:hypothetical protein
MIRMFSVAMGVSLQRIAALVFVLLTREGPESWFAESVWIGFALGVAAAEVWIRSTRRQRVAHPALSALEPVT